jgi:hypothetical protein
MGSVIRTATYNYSLKPQMYKQSDRGPTVPPITIRTAGQYVHGQNFVTIDGEV